MQEIDCPCGKKHSLGCDEIVVDKNALELLLERSKQASVLFITDKYGYEVLEGHQLCGKHMNLPEFTMTTSFADSLPDRGQELVVAIGREELISVAKFYAYKFSSKLYIYPLGNFTDFTFSSFARLYDGVDIGFFKAAEPSKIFVCPTAEPNALQAYYMSTKFLVLFDNLVAEMVYEQRPCKKMQEYFKSALKSYLSPCAQPEESAHLVWSLIRIGQGMTYFGETKYFLGAERAVADLMCVLRRADYLEMVNVAHKLVLNAYCCFFPETPLVGEFNLNKHINALSVLMKVPPSVIISRLPESKLMWASEEIRKRFLSYQPYFRRVFTRLTNRTFALEAKLNLLSDGLKKNKFTLSEVEKCFALSPLACSRPTGMNLILSFGYLDKLL